MRSRSTTKASGPQRASARRPKPRRLHSAGEQELQGRAGESLSAHEPTFIGNEPDKHWEYHEGSHKPQRETKEPGVNPPRRTGRRRIAEIEYERGPRSKHQIEGRGGSHSRRRRQG